MNYRSNNETSTKGSGYTTPFFTTNKKQMNKKLFFASTIVFVISIAIVATSFPLETFMLSCFSVMLASLLVLMFAGRNK
jgi:hypothetical protein